VKTEVLINPEVNEMSPIYDEIIQDMAGNALSKLFE